MEADFPIAEYILAVRAGLDRPRVLLQRTLAEVWMNDYNEVLLRLWRANMDIQYVLNAHAAAQYIANYTSEMQ